MDGESSSLISALICTLAKPGSNSLTVILVVMLTSYALKNHCNLVYICNPPSFILNTIHVYAFTSIAFREVFNLFDINGGGTIDADELDAALKTVDINLTYKEIQDVLHVIDEDGKYHYTYMYIANPSLSKMCPQVLALLLACFIYLQANQCIPCTFDHIWILGAVSVVLSVQYKYKNAEGNKPS